MSGIPAAIAADYARAKRLEWWTLAWMGSIIVVMYFAMGTSQAMRSALVEDLLSLVPAITFLVASRIEPKPATARYPFGFARVNSLAFLISAVALTMVGSFVAWEAISALIAQEHPTVGPVEIFGQRVWLGWLMIAALVYSIVPPVILGHRKLPVARRLRDKVLHTDALMQKADWQTGVTGIVGIVGIGLGYWWADSAAALLIALSILKDGVKSIRTASAELLDGEPREMDGPAVSEEADGVRRRLREHYPGCEVRLRESGRYMVATVSGIAPPARLPSKKVLTGDVPDWRLARVDFEPPQDEEA